jgi:hypothetical protein
MSAAEIPSGGVPASAIHNRSAHAKPPVTPRRGEPSDRFYKNPKFFVRIYYKQRRTSGGGESQAEAGIDAHKGLGTGIVSDPAQ